MAAALVQNRNAVGESSGSPSLAFSSNVTAGNTLVLIFTTYNDADVTVSSVGNSLGGSLTLRVGPQRNSSNSNVAKWIFSQDNASGGATTLTVNMADASFIPYLIEIFEVSGLDSAGSYIDSSAANGADSTVPDPGNVDNTVADAFLICASSSGGGGPGGSPTAASGWTAVDPSNAFWFDFTQYRIVSSVASWSTSMATAVGAWAAVAAAFQAADEGGGGGTARGTPFGHRGTAFNGGRTFHGIIQ